MGGGVKVQFLLRVGRPLWVLQGVVPSGKGEINIGSNEGAFGSNNIQFKK